MRKGEIKVLFLKVLQIGNYLLGLLVLERETVYERVSMCERELYCFV